MKKLTLIAGVAAVVATGVLAQAQMGPHDAAIKARQSHMRLNAFNLGVLGAMAQGKSEYDAEAAQAAAGNLVALSSITHQGYWPEGSDADAVDGTRALPALWQDPGDVSEKLDALKTAAAAMNDAAGQGQEALQAAFGALGGACGGCHKAYRQPQ